MPRKGWSRVRVAFGVLGPVVAWDGAGGAIALKGPRHRAVLARLIVARRRVVPVTRLVEDLWEDPPADAAGAVRTFVAALRRALEPQRPPRAQARLLVTEGSGYALHAEPGGVDAWRFERAVAAAATLPPQNGLARLEEALGWWRGPAYADFADEAWARAERSRLGELRLHAVERQAEARLALGLAGEAVPDLDAHVTEHPWREDAWGCWPSRCTAPAARATRSRCCAGHERSWPNNWGWIWARVCAAWRRTSSTTQTTSTPLPGPAVRRGGCGRRRPPTTTEPSHLALGRDWSQRWACCAVSR